MSEAPQKEVRVSPLAPARRTGAEFANNDHRVTVEQGVTMEDVVKPDFWAHVAPKLRPYDEIRLCTDDGMFYARLLVLSVGRNWAKVFTLEVHELTTKDVDMSQAEAFDGYEVKYRGPHCKFSVVRKSDSEVVKEGLGTKSEAHAWLADHVKQTA
jgi:hypothetical protein